LTDACLSALDPSTYPRFQDAVSEVVLPLNLNERPEGERECKMVDSAAAMQRMMS
jgi:hypothetical protein